MIKDRQDDARQRKDNRNTLYGLSKSRLANHAGLLSQSGRFSDPVFVNLTCAQVKAMWHMLVVNAKDLEIAFNNVKADQLVGSCDWEAKYRFSRTDRQVHNRIQATFRFSDGRIIFHHDRFDLWKWSRMAFGITGSLLGWTSFFREKIRTTALRGLYRFIDENPQYK